MRGGADFNAWLQFATAQGNADAESRQARLQHVGELETVCLASFSNPRPY